MARIDMYDAIGLGEKALVATEGRGLIELDTRRWKHRSLGSWPLDSLGFYFSLCLDTASKLLLIGGQKGLIEYSIASGKARLINTPSGMGAIRAILKDPVTGRYWIGAEHGIFCKAPPLDKDVFVARTSQSFQGKRVAALLIRRGTRELWIGHERGVDVLDIDAARFRSSLMGATFRNPRVVSMLEDLEGRIWMGTYAGIVGFDPVSKEFCRLNRENGLLNFEFNYKSALRLADGRLIFGGLNGYDILDPRNIRFSNTAGKGIVTGLHHFRGSDTLFEPLPTGAGSVALNIRDEFLRIYLSSANMLQAQQHSYEYDLDGEGQWIGVSNPSHINLAQLDPGLHTLDIRGFDEFGRLIGFDRLVIRAREPFLRSRFFQVLLTLAAIAFLSLFIFVLLRSRRKEKALKERISMDLHDEVGTILTRALYVARLDNEGSKDHRLIHYLNESLFSLRAYIHTMNTPSFSFLALADEVKEMVHSLMSPSPCVSEVRHLTDAEYLLKGELYRDVRLCLYEIINNMLKHSEGDRLRVVLMARRGLLTVQTTDNGHLRSTEDLRESGNGIRNLRKRVSKHRGDIQFSVGRAGNGLVVRMRFPL